MLSPVQQEALVEFGTTGRTNNLASIGEACDTICGEAPHYPLAVMLRRLGLPDATSDSEVCQLARRISSRTGPGNIGTIRTWLTPIIGSALLAWHNCVTRHTATAPEETRTLGATLSATYSSREQFLLAVLGDLASSGNLNPSRAFLRTYTADFEALRNEHRRSLLVLTEAEGQNHEPLRPNIPSIQAALLHPQALAAAASQYEVAEQAHRSCLQESQSSNQAGRQDQASANATAAVLQQRLTAAAARLQNVLARATNFVTIGNGLEKPHRYIICSCRNAERPDGISRPVSLRAVGG